MVGGQSMQIMCSDTEHLVRHAGCNCLPLPQQNECRVQRIANLRLASLHNISVDMCEEWGYLLRLGCQQQW